VQGAFEYLPLIIYLQDLAHKYLIGCALQWCKSSKLHSSKFLHHGRSKSAVPAGHKQKKLFFPLQTL
jgi:hypothetical protein